MDYPITYRVVANKTDSFACGKQFLLLIIANHSSKRWSD